METELLIHIVFGSVMLACLSINVYIGRRNYSTLIRLVYVFIIGILGIFLFQSESNLLILYALFFPFMSGGLSLISFFICLIVYFKTKNASQLAMDSFVTFLMLLPSLLVFLALFNSNLKIGG